MKMLKKAYLTFSFGNCAPIFSYHPYLLNITAVCYFPSFNFITLIKFTFSRAKFSKHFQKAFFV